LRVVKQLSRLLADNRVFKDRRIPSAQFPGVKERRPIDVGIKSSSEIALSAVPIACINTHPDKFRLGRRVGRQSIGVRFTRACSSVISFFSFDFAACSSRSRACSARVFSSKSPLGSSAQQSAHHPTASTHPARARCWRDNAGRFLHRGMRAARGRTADQQRQGEPFRSISCATCTFHRATA
jgi:hypothetical protein